jgi:probable HAF family extracellular repeat protein
MWYDGSSTDLGTLGGAGSRGQGLNDDGVVVGEAWTGAPDDVAHAAVWDAGIPFDLGEAGRASAAASINSHGLIVGFERDQLGLDHAMLWENGVGRRLDRFTTRFSHAVGINDAGQVLLTAFLTGADGAPQTFLWESGRLTEVGALDGTGINSWGHVIGYRASELLDLQGLFWQVGSISWVSDASSVRAEPLGINDSSQVVGWMWQMPGVERAFLWENGEMVDLNNRIAADSGWQLFRATAINNSGQIVGAGLFQGQQAGFC